MKLTIKVPAEADVDVFDVMVRIVDHFREDASYSDEARALGIAGADDVLRAIKTKTGNRAISGNGHIGS